MLKLQSSASKSTINQAKRAYVRQLTRMDSELTESIMIDENQGVHVVGTATTATTATTAATAAGGGDDQAAFAALQKLDSVNGVVEDDGADDVAGAFNQGTPIAQLAQYAQL